MDKKSFDKKMESAMRDIAEIVIADYQKGRDIDNIDELYNMPEKDEIIDITEKLLRIVFPGYNRDKVYKSYNINNNLVLLLEDIAFNLNKQLVIILRREAQDYSGSSDIFYEEALKISTEFLSRIPKIREFINTDIQATFDGDPAAYSKDEIILAYPGLYAIAINRLAHELFLMNVPLIPRIMTEYAHGLTGIDIHPGATIGKYFFIDHGTGIVVGETTHIGDHVKLYQGVTLGALSTTAGQRLRNTQRHPTIEDNVTIYSGASILGGNTVIGANSVVGSNVFITTSIKPWTRVSVKNQELQIKDKSPQAGDFGEGGIGQDSSWFYTI